MTETVLAHTKLLKFCNNCLFVEVSNNEILDFLTSSLYFLNFC